jgi:hypothetical protein
MNQIEEHARRVLAAIFAAGTETCPMPFALYRDQDVTGISGTGTVATGVQFDDGTAVLRWRGATPSTVLWASLDDAMKIHGHDGKTRLVWLAAPFSEMGEAERDGWRNGYGQGRDDEAAGLPVREPPEDAGALRVSQRDGDQPGNNDEREPREP